MGNKLKVVGLLATLVAFGAGMITDFVNEKKQEELIDQKVKKYLEDHE